MPPSSIHDHPGSHIDGAYHRREAATKPKEIKPLWTHEPLSHDREKKSAAQPPKKRKRPQPTKPALSFDPECNRVPSGRQGPPLSPFSAPSAAQSPTSPQPATPFVDREDHDQIYDYDVRPRAISECSYIEPSTSSYPNTPCTDMNEGSVPPDPYDSPASCTSSSSPAPSDQSPCAADFPVRVVEYMHLAPPSLPMYLHGSQAYAQQPVVHQNYAYSTDPCSSRPPQGYPTPYFEPAYNRAAPHGIPGYPESNGFSYPPHRY